MKFCLARLFNKILSVKEVYCFYIFLWSQKTNLLQKDGGFFIQQHGASREVINSGRVLSFSTSPRDIDGKKKEFLKNIQNSFIVKLHMQSK